MQVSVSICTYDSSVVLSRNAPPDLGCYCFAAPRQQAVVLHNGEFVVVSSGYQLLPLPKRCCLCLLLLPQRCGLCLRLCRLQLRGNSSLLRTHKQQQHHSTCTMNGK
jgi:hypothetical protein